MSTKLRLKKALQEAARLRTSGEFAQARKLLNSLAVDPDIDLLGQYTSFGLPRQLHSAQMKLVKAEKDTLRSVGYQYHLVPPPALLNSHAKFSSEERKQIAQANRQVVPHTIHQIWIGDRALPAGTRAWEAHARTHGYHYRLWRETQLRQMGFDQHPVYLDMVLRGDLPGAVDVARYLILQQFGGVYLDCDWYPARKDLGFHDLLPMTGIIAMAEDIPRNTGKGGLLLANSMIAAPAQHPVFARLLQALPAVIKDLPDSPAWWSTGPLIFTLMCRGGSMTLADASLVAGSLPQETPLSEVEAWCRESQSRDAGLLLSWKSWIW